MKAHEAMTKDVVTVAATATVAEIAALLVRHRISAVPVVNAAGEIVGIVSQTDLAHRSETATEKKRKWWLEMFADSDTKAREYVKSHGLKAHDVMSRFVVSIDKDASLAQVADLMDAHRIRQVPVTEDRKLVGIISRADLVRKLAEVTIGPPVARADNGALHKAIRDQLKAQAWLNTSFMNFTVNDGIVELWGVADSDEQRRAVRVLVEAIPGVRKVDDRMGLYPRVVSA